jgi:RNase P/RNase MRP subunit p29
MLYLNIWLDMWEGIRDGIVTQFVQGLSAGIPKFIAALLVVIVGVVIVRLLRKFLSKGLEALGIDRVAERINEIDLVQNSGTKIKFSALISQSVYLFLMLIIIMAATDILQIKVLSDIMRDLLNYLPSLVTALIIALFGVLVADMLRNIVLTACQSLGIPSAKIIASVVFYFIFLAVVISALGQAKINTGFISANLTVIIGAVALAFAVGYGLASRDLMSNYLAGQYNGNRIRIGDDVRLIGMRGKVVMIDSTTLTLQTDDRAIIIPLSKLTTEKVELFYPDGQDERLLGEGDDA